MCFGLHNTVNVTSRKHFKDTETIPKEESWNILYVIQFSLAKMFECQIQQRALQLQLRDGPWPQNANRLMRDKVNIHINYNIK